MPLRVSSMSVAMRLNSAIAALTSSMFVDKIPEEAEIEYLPAPACLSVPQIRAAVRNRWPVGVLI